MDKKHLNTICTHHKCVRASKWLEVAAAFAPRSACCTPMNPWSRWKPPVPAERWFSWLRFKPHSFDGRFPGSMARIAVFCERNHNAAGFYFLCVFLYELDFTCLLSFLFWLALLKYGYRSYFVAFGGNCILDVWLIYLYCNPLFGFSSKTQKQPNVQVANSFKCLPRLHKSFINARTKNIQYRDLLITQSIYSRTQFLAHAEFTKIQTTTNTQ